MAPRWVAPGHDSLSTLSVLIITNTYNKYV
jgi:hypothetical protein